MVEYESILEAQAIKLLDLAPQIDSFQEQPEIVYYYQKGKNKKYYPDFELKMNSGQVLHIEIKPIKELKKLTIAIKYYAIYEQYLTRAEHFVILTEEQIRRQSGDHDIYQLLNNDNIEKLRGICNA